MYGHGGFSYIRLPIKQVQNILEREASKHTSQNQKVTGTIADLRKATMDDCKQFLVQRGFKENSIE